MGTSVPEKPLCVGPTVTMSCDGCVTSTLLTADELESKTPTKPETTRLGETRCDDYLAVHCFGASQCPDFLRVMGCRLLVSVTAVFEYEASDSCTA